MNFTELIKAHQQKIALTVGFVAVAAVGFYAGLNINSQGSNQPSVPAVSATTHYTETKPQTQPVESTPKEAVSGTTTGSSLDCTGKIKGSSTHKYHVPGGVFYKQTTHPIACFDTEAEAKAAGFVRSSR